MAIAITGIGCRFPGARGPDELWKLLIDGVDAIRETPPTRFDVDAYQDLQPEGAEKPISRWGGFIDDVDGFDAAFFGISPREASRMDPQQRLLLETTWEALEDAGEVPARLAGSRTGVFVGQIASDYADILRQVDALDIHGAMGASARCALAGRISYALDARGPSIVVDTACSSSLEAIHLACQSLRTGESTLALAGGVNLILVPESTIVYSRAGMLAADGRCKFGDARADGFVRSDGVGMVVLKPLLDAVRDGDPVRAVIVGSATNNDGRGSGYLMKPAESGQADMMRRAYEDAGIDPSDVDYLEAHGTGTPAGDPVELRAATQVLGGRRPGDRPCLLGSIKTNIGHPEGASGVAGLIKAVLCLQHGMVPPSLHLDTPSPDIDWSAMPARIPTRTEPLPARDRPRLAAVNSFGISGSNAHVILREALAADTVPDTSAPPTVADDEPHLLVLSARDPLALPDLARANADRLRADDARPADICYTAAVRRSHHDHRLAVSGDSARELADRLDVFARGETTAGVVTTEAGARRRPRVAFVFPGQGSQWVGMGRRLLDESPAFATTMRDCDEAIRAEAGWSLLERLRADDADAAGLDRIDVVQPALWAIEVSLAALWRSWGIEPDVVVGHSMGEVAAACVAGALDLADGAAVICRRSALLHRHRGSGAMASVDLPADAAREAIAGYRDRVAIAAHNGPSSTVLSGDPHALAEILDELDRAGVFCRRVAAVDIASHSPGMDALLPELVDRLSSVRPRAARIPLHSTVLDQECDGTELDAGYWARNLREPVRFTQAVRAIAERADTAFVEISPHPILASPVEDCLVDAGLSGTVVASLRRGEPERPNLVRSLGQLYVLGCPVDWAAVHDGRGRHVPLPTYPWRHQRFWVEQPATDRTVPARDVNAVRLDRHPLAHRLERTATDADRRVWTGPLATDEAAYLWDHTVEGAVVLTGTAFLELMAAVATRELGPDGPVLRGIDYHAPLLLRHGAGPHVELTLERETGTRWRCGIRSRGRDRENGRSPWTLHATAEVAPREAPGVADHTDLASIRSRCARRVSGREFYRQFSERGVQWLGDCRPIDEIWCGPGESLARVRCPESIADELAGYRFHPALLDACGQAFAALFLADGTSGDDVFMLSAIDEVSITDRPRPVMWSHAELVGSADTTSVTGNIRIFDESGRTIAALRGARLRYLSRERDDAHRGARPNHEDWLHEIAWTRRDAPPGEQPARGAWLVLADRTGVGESVRARLLAAGNQVTTVVPGREFARLGAGRYQVHPEEAAQFDKILAERAGESAGWAGVVHLWNLDAAPIDQAGPDAVADAELVGCRSLAGLATAVVEADLGRIPRTWVVTRGAQPVADADTIAPLQAPAWGLGRALTREHPALRCTLVDLDVAGADPAASLWDELCRADEADQVALRRDGRYAPRLVPMSQPDLVRPDATYLITGGLGDLGRRIARLLVDRGARSLLLTGRSAASGEIVRELEAAGAAVTYAAVDVGNLEEMRALLDNHARRGGQPIRGVVHAAGVIRYEPVADLDRERLDEVLGPKVRGGWVLHRLFHDEPLDFFVLFSSVSSLVSSPMLSAYAAGNAFLDSLAHHRRRLGLPALTINWGLWSGTGMADHLKHVGGRRQVRPGMSEITPEEGVAMFERVLGRPDAQVAIVPIDRPVWTEERAPVVSVPPPRVAADAEPVRTNESPREDRSSLALFVRERIGDVLRLPVERLDAGRPLKDLGLDSLLAGEVRTAIRRELDVKIPLVRLLGDNTIEDVVDAVLEHSS